MTEPHTQSTGIEDLVERLRARVEERKRAGEYPEGLEDQLEEHFRRIVFHRVKAETNHLQEDVDAIDAHMDFRLKEVPVSSDLPGGDRLHRALNNAITRHTQPMSEQLQGFAEAVRVAIRALGMAVQDPASHVHGDLLGHLDAVLERLDNYERGPVTDELAIADLRRRVEALERAEAAREVTSPR